MSNHADDWQRTLRIADALGLRTYPMMTGTERIARGLPHERAQQLAWLQQHGADLFASLQDWERADG